MPKQNRTTAELLKAYFTDDKAMVRHRIPPTPSLPSVPKASMVSSWLPLAACLLLFFSFSLASGNQSGLASTLGDSIRTGHLREAGRKLARMAERSLLATAQELQKHGR